MKDMLPTPSTSHVNIDRVYEPAEDSFLIIDTLSSGAEIKFLSDRFGNQHLAKSLHVDNASPLLLEVGTGSGVVLAFFTAHAQRIFGRSDILTIGSDVNHFACQASQRTVSQACMDVGGDQSKSGDWTHNGTMLASLNADLTSSFRAGMVDILIFNPPYVPSSQVPLLLQQNDGSAVANLSRKDGIERDSALLSLSYEGGKDGMEVTNRLLEQLPAVLCEDKGTAYILLCQQNKPSEVIDRIREWGPRWSVEEVGHSDRKAGWEKLRIIRICRIPMLG